eukprot:11887788-Alexandrium_andersonii.AAC.2
MCIRDSAFAAFQRFWPAIAQPVTGAVAFHCASCHIAVALWMEIAIKPFAKSFAEHFPGQPMSSLPGGHEGRGQGLDAAPLF